MTQTIPDQTDYFALPPIDADGESAQQGYVDEYVNRDAPSITTDDYDDPSPIVVSLIRSANNQTHLGPPLLDYRINLLIGEQDARGYDWVVSFYELDRAEQLARHILAACEVARADLKANSGFVTGEVA